MAIYLTRRLRRDRLKEIGEAFQRNTYSSVSGVIERLNRVLAADRRLRQRVERIIRNIDKSQEQTPFHPASEERRVSYACEAVSHRIIFVVVHRATGEQRGLP